MRLLKIKLINSKIKNIEWLSHSIDKDKNVGIFTLNECNYNKEYRTKVDKFFDEIFENKISNIIIDMRSNFFSFNSHQRGHCKCRQNVVNIIQGSEGKLNLKLPINYGYSLLQICTGLQAIRMQAQ